MRAPRERDGHASRQDVQDCQSPMGAASVPGTPVNGTIHAPWGFCSSYRRPADGRTARHAARLAAHRLLDGTCSIFAGTVVCHVVVGFIGTLRVSTAPTILRWA